MGGAGTAARGSGRLRIRIAPLTPADLDDARGLAVLGDVPVGSDRRWQRDLARPAAVLLGAWDGPRLVGVATGEVAVDDADVHLVVVHPDHRRRGVGAALLRALCTALAALGAGRVLLEVRADNTAARALYAGLGFVEVARRRGYYRDGDDALVLAVDAATLPD